MSSAWFKQQERVFDFSTVFKCLDETSNLYEVVEQLIANYSLELYKVWHSIWAERGYDILHQTWNSEYGHLLADNSKHETNVPEQSTANDGLEKITSDWQPLWEEHVAVIYEKYYHYYVDAFWFYCCLLQKSAKELVIDSSENLDIENEDITNLTSEVECMKLLGLPTSFSNSHRKLTKVNENLNLSLLINELEEEEEKEEEFYSSDSSDNENLNMAKTENACSEKNSSANLRTIKKKTKSKNRKLRHVPEFLRGDNNLLKYWRKRYSLFSRFDQGIQLDQESWFSVTPEKVANNLAKRLKCNLIIDGFCGCGGNTIQFANYCERVIAIDIDETKIAMARKNAEIYGVAHKIEFIVDDFLKFCTNTQITADVVFLSPPWGGPKYKKNKNYDIEQSLLPVSATELMQCAHKISENIVFFLPRNANIQQVIKLAGVGNNCEIQHNFLNERLIAITAFYGSDIIKEKDHSEAVNTEEEII